MQGKKFQLVLPERHWKLLEKLEHLLTDENKSEVVRVTLELTELLVAEFKAKQWHELMYHARQAASIYKMIRQTQTDGGAIIIRDASGQETKLFIPS